jgi:hypothetical protein
VLAFPLFLQSRWWCRSSPCSLSSVWWRLAACQPPPYRWPRSAYQVGLDLHGSWSLTRSQVDMLEPVSIRICLAILDVSSKYRQHCLVSNAILTFYRELDKGRLCLGVEQRNLCWLNVQ